MKIYKYEIKLDDDQTISLPTGAKILTVQIQGRIPYIWAMFDENLGGLEPRKISVIGTGNPMPEVGRYIGTFQMLEGMLVWHVFESEVKE